MGLAPHKAKSPTISIGSDYLMCVRCPLVPSLSVLYDEAAGVAGAENLRQSW